MSQWIISGVRVHGDYEIHHEVRVKHGKCREFIDWRAGTDLYKCQCGLLPLPFHVNADVEVK